MTTTQDSPTAAGSGANASDAFKAGQERRGRRGRRRRARQRRRLHDSRGCPRHHPRAPGHLPRVPGRQAWLMEVGESGEWPLFMDVFVEHVVEEVAAETQRGTKGTIEGPYYLPEQVELAAICDAPAPRRTSRAPRWCSRARSVASTVRRSAAPRSTSGTPTPTATTPASPRTCRKETCAASSSPMTEGRFAISTVQPAPYQIPTDGPTGKLIEAAGWHPWRPAHLHVMVRAEGHRTVTTQLYFAGGDWLDSDVAEATKPELILDPADDGTGTRRSTYDFELEPV